MSLANRELFPANRPPDFNIRFPVSNGRLAQDEEWFEFDLHGQTERMRIHDYAALYSVPGLYEALVYDALACRSPQRLVSLLAQVLKDQDADVQDLRVLDLGAGNGIVAQELQAIGVRHIVGMDLLREARLAAGRDRPGLYADYLVADLCHLGERDRTRLEQNDLNCLVAVAALGFDDIAPESFVEAFNLISAQALLGLTIKEEFLSARDESGFAQLIDKLVEQQIIEIQSYERYCHRLSITGEQLFYISVIARKARNIPA